VIGRHSEILSWRNYELIRVQQSCIDKCYELCIVSKPLWEYASLRADSFVATHAIEHIREHELEKLVSKLVVKSCLIEAPLGDEPKSWNDYQGTHILEVGWKGVDAIFAARGYKAEEKWVHGRYYVRR